jgi:hypothetical protein
MVGVSVHRAIGGAVVTSYGALTLAQARRLADFYVAEARHCRSDNAAAAARLCEERSGDLGAAVAAAILWRRAAGWRDPAAADRTRQGDRRESVRGGDDPPFREHHGRAEHAAPGHDVRGTTGRLSPLRPPANIPNRG